MRKYVFIDQELSTLKKEMTNEKSFLFDRLVNEYLRYKEMELPTLHPKKSTTYMGIAIMNLSLLTLLTEKQEYLEETKRWINAVVNYEKWGNAHLVNVDLSASWIMFGLSLGYDWIKDFLTEEEKTVVLLKLKLQADIMFTYKKENEGHGWSTNYWQNHNWINMSGLAACGYVLKDVYEDAQKWIEDSKENFKIVFDNFAEDGSNYEGVVYWRYGGMWLFVYAHLLKNMEGFNYFESSKYLENTFYYRLYQAAPNLEETINFGDCHDLRSGHSIAVYYKVAAEYGNGHAQKLGNTVQNEFLNKEQYLSNVKPGILPEAVFEFLWYDHSVKEEEFNTLPLMKHFEDLGLIVVRNSWDKDSLHMSFKCSSPGGKKQWEKGWELFDKQNYKSLSLSHHHPDNNSFIIHKNGEALVLDDGYNRNIMPDDHNTITVDGKFCPVHDVNDVYMKSVEKLLKETDNFNPRYFKGEITSINENDDIIMFAGETAKIYDPSLKLYHNERTMIYPRKDYVVVIDDLKSDLEHHYTFNLHTKPAKHEIKGDKIRFVFDQSKLRIHSVYPEQKDIEIADKSIRAVMTTQEPDNYRETLMNQLKITSKVKKKDELFVNILNFSDTREKIRVLRFSGEGYIGCKISTKKYTDLVLYTNESDTRYNGYAIPKGITFIKQDNRELKIYSNN